MTFRLDPTIAAHIAPPQATRGDTPGTVRPHTEMRDRWADEALAYAEGLRRDLEVLLRALPNGSSVGDDAGQRQAV